MADYRYQRLLITQRLPIFRYDCLGNVQRGRAEARNVDEEGDAYGVDQDYRQEAQRLAALS